MLNIVNDVLTLARNEIGVTEYPDNSNCVKYNTAYYGKQVSGSGYAWCAVFIWWLFRQCGISYLYYNGKKTAYVPALHSFAKQNNLIVDKPQPGDLVLFDFNANGAADHIGICESFDGEYVTTIDGNTGSGNEANGGAVMRRRRMKRYILAVIRPEYEKHEKKTEKVGDDEPMTQDQFDAMMENWLSRQAAKTPVAAWETEWLSTVTGEHITDGSRPMAFCTRLEAAIMAHNAAKG